MSEENQYVPPAVWKWNQDAVNKFSNINRPISGAIEEKIITGHVPHYVSLSTEYLAVVGFCDKPPSGFFEIPLIFKWQTLPELRLNFSGKFRRLFAFGIKMLTLRVNR